MSNRIGTTQPSLRKGALILATAALMASGSLTSSAITSGDAVLQWNQLAIDATVTAGQGAVPQIRTMAIVQVAMHDAVNSITGKYDTYLTSAPAPAGASAEAAAIAAAHRALMALFGNQFQTFNAARAAALEARGLSEFDPGIAWGESVAAAVLAARATDGSAQATFPYVAPNSGDPGVWVAIGTTPAQLPGWGKVTPWVLGDPAQFQPGPPPKLKGGAYARDYQEIQALGAAVSPIRTAEQTEIARFWLGSPSAIWNRVARQIISARNLDISDTTRSLALMYLAAADASIVCWDAKYTHNFWRPQAAIRNGDLDGNAKTVADPAWLPLFATPPHPEYLSGHTTNSSAMATTLAYLFGDNTGNPIVATSPTNVGFTRYWSSLSEGVDEVIEARIYSGIHFRTADEVGAKVGGKVAKFVFSHALR